MIALGSWKPAIKPEKKREKGEEILQGTITKSSRYWMEVLTGSEPPVGGKAKHDALHYLTLERAWSIIMH